MKLSSYSIFGALMILLTSCSPEEGNPEGLCEISNEYFDMLNQVLAADVYDIGTRPPLKVNNDRLEYTNVYDYLYQYTDKTKPMKEDFDIVSLRSLAFVNDTLCEVVSSKNNRVYEFECDTSNCEVTLRNDQYTLYGSLEKGGKELVLQRYAVYSHETTPSGLDTFTLLMNVDQRIGSMSDVADFVQSLYPGLIDTILIEPINNGFE